MFSRGAIHDSLSTFTVSSYNLVAAGANVQGRRVSNEDEDDFLINEKYSFFAIYDGHSGDSCSKFLKAHLLNSLSRLENLSKNKIEKLFIDIDEAYKNSFESKSGSTAIIVVIDNKEQKAMFINLGDSSGMIIRDGVPIYETVLHSPDLEKERITDAGYYVFSGRILGSIAVSRSFGDFFYKIKNEKFTEAGISNIPDVSEWMQLEKDDMIVINCDGLTEPDIDNKKIASQIYKKNITRKEMLDRTLQVLGRSLHDSYDNISVTCIGCFSHRNDNVDVEKDFFPGTILSICDRKDLNMFKITAERNLMEISDAFNKRKKTLEDFFEGTLEETFQNYLISRTKKSHELSPDLEILRNELKKLSDSVWMRDLFKKSPDLLSDDDFFS